MATASSGRFAPAASWKKGLAAVLTVAGLFAFPSTSAAQVLEIGTSGAVVVHDRPAVFDDRGSSPIASPRGRVIAGRPPHAAMIADAAALTAVSEDLIAAVAWRESRMRASAVSRAGARGEMQLMPATARSLGVDPADSGQNYRGGAAYLRRLLIRYDGDLVKTLAAYNAGPGAVDRHHGVPPYPETRAYVAAVLDRLSRAAEMTQ